MDNEVYSFALKSALTEIRNVCPCVKNSFIFNEDGEIVVDDENAPEGATVRVVDAFDGILERADTVGGVEGMTFECNQGTVKVSCMNDIYLVTVTSKEADLNHLNALTRVLIPTVLKLLEKINPAPLKNNASPAIMEPRISKTKDVKRKTDEFTEEPSTEEPKNPSEPEPEPTMPETPVNQLIVENLGGLLVPSDTVRIDGATLAQWGESYGGKKIEEVEIETFDGKATQCKVKALNDPKYEGKGIIRMPEKIQLTLEIKKGELVRVKPAGL